MGTTWTFIAPTEQSAQDYMSKFLAKHQEHCSIFSYNLRKAYMSNGDIRKWLTVDEAGIKAPRFCWTEEKERKQA